MANSKTYPMPDPVALAAKVRAAGGPAIDPTQQVGQASADGVTIGWVVTGVSVTLTILHKPFFIPADTIWSHADAIFAA